MARKKAERPNDNLDALIQEYYNLDVQMKELQEKKDPLNRTIKLAMRSRGITKYRAGELTAVCATQVRTKYIDEPAVRKLKSLGLPQAIKEVVDADAVKDLIKTGQLTEAVLADYMEIKEVELLSIKRE